MGKKAEVKLDDWQAHVLVCKKCQTVNIDTPATLINCCLDGAPHLRGHLVAMQAPKVRARNRALKAAFTDENHCTKKRMKELTKHVAPSLF